jgi:hypothetical protein
LNRQDARPMSRTSYPHHTVKELKKGDATFNTFSHHDGCLIPGPKAMEPMTMD